jgi:hypothetical protein
MKPVALFSWQSFGTQLKHASVGVAPDTSARKSRKLVAQEPVDKAMKELDEELEDAREFAFKALEVKAEP